jgi:predicted membrane protein
VGVIFQVDELNLFRWWSAEVLWPIALIAVGMWLMVGRMHPRAPQARVETATAAAVEGSDTLDATAFFSSFACAVTSKQFRGGAATAIFGEVKLDLRQAELAPGEQRLDVTSVLGGAEVRVPASWNVIVDGTPVLGQVKDKRWPAGAAPPGAGSGGSSLRIRGTAVLGEIKVDT